MEPLHERVSRRQKAMVLLSIDAVLIPLSIWIALQLRLGIWWPVYYFPQGTGLFLLMPLIGVTLSWVMGIPRVVLRAFERHALVKLAQFAMIMAVICAVLNTGLGFGLPRSIPGIWAAVFLVLAVSARFTILTALEIVQDLTSDKKPVLIYGAGSTGQQLMAALRSSHELKPVGFLDDNLALRRVEVSGMRVFQPSLLEKLVRDRGVKQVILAMPSAQRRQQREIVERLQGLDLEVQTLPSFVDMLDGRSLMDQVRPVSADELLGRDTVDLTGPEISSAYRGKVVLVSGAGGSIGSELVRQLIEARPSKIILFEQSELALYTIDMELARLEPAGIKIVSVLGSVCDAGRVASTLSEHGVEIVLHAAAYKHVPLIEDNPIEGARNNILGTRTIAEASVKAGVERFILISTDKAVRPTNVMGATKRMAEMVVQDLQTRSNRTILTMVRFGNVLGSSGSVIPLFRDQIAKGGPVTLTHRDVTRYFMTIPEAAQLVLLAGSFAEGGEVFVLDMGKPVRIYDLARSMIELSGFEPRDETNPDGDIEIRVTGLRPGEKLYEELLIGDNVIPTPHPKIMRAMEGMLEAETLKTEVARIEGAVSASEPDMVRDVLEINVDGLKAD